MHAEIWMYLKRVLYYQSLFSKEKKLSLIFFVIRSAAVRQGHVIQASCVRGLAAGYDSIPPFLLKKSSAEFLHLTGNCWF